MKILKPHLCGWLFKTWEHLQSKQMVKAIIKVWHQCGLLQAFEPSFQMTAMDVNMKTPLFGIVYEDVEPYNIDKDTNQPIESVIQDSITRVAEITTSNKYSSVSMFMGMARKRYVSTTQNP